MSLGSKSSNKPLLASTSASYNSPKSAGKGLGLGAVSSSKPSSSKSYSPSLYSTPKSSKSRFGILWIPTRKRNKSKDKVYHSHKDNYNERSPSMHNFMYGDSSENQPHKKKEEGNAPPMSETVKTPAATVASVSGAADNMDLPQNMDGNMEEQHFITHEYPEPVKKKWDCKEDGDKEEDQDYLENEDKSKSHDSKWDKNKLCDKVDSVYLRPPPPHKARSTASTAVEQEDCGITCLYYAMQCCDCSIM